MSPEELRFWRLGVLVAVGRSPKELRIWRLGVLDVVGMSPEELRFWRLGVLVVVVCRRKNSESGGDGGFGGLLGRDEFKLDAESICGSLELAIVGEGEGENAAKRKYPKRQLRRWWWRLFLSSRERELLYSLSGLLMSHPPQHFSFFRQTPVYIVFLATKSIN
ncbi:unnamed protein product, partial [Vitis vinifera]